jgi:hypothetical protein
LRSLEVEGCGVEDVIKEDLSSQSGLRDTSRGCKVDFIGNGYLLQLNRTHFKLPF